jgi:hypothetical protein
MSADGLRRLLLLLLVVHQVRLLLMMRLLWLMLLELLHSMMRVQLVRQLVLVLTQILRIAVEAHAAHLCTKAPAVVHRTRRLLLLWLLCVGLRLLWVQRCDFVSFVP